MIETKVLSAVNWLLYSNAPECGIHPGNVSGDSKNCWIFRNWPTNYRCALIGVDKDGLASRIDDMLPLSFLNGLRVALAASGREVVVVNGSRLGLPSAFFLRCSPKKTVAVIDNAMSDFIGEGHRISNLLCRFLLRGIDVVVCHSSEQVPLYERFLGPTQSKFVFIPYGVSSEEIKTESIPRIGDYAFAGGDAYRDYETYCRAVRGTGMSSIIASSRLAVDPLNIPREVNYIGRVGFTMYKEMMAQSRLVIVPLKAHPVSQGQLAITQAMGMGKTVVATDSTGTRDYIVDGETGFLVPPSDPQSLKGVLESLWNDFTVLKRVGEAAIDAVNDHFTEEKMAHGILDEIEKRMKRG